MRHAAHDRRSGSGTERVGSVHDLRAVHGSNGGEDVGVVVPVRGQHPLGDLCRDDEENVEQHNTEADAFENSHDVTLPGAHGLPRRLERPLDVCRPPTLNRRSCAEHHRAAERSAPR